MIYVRNGFIYTVKYLQKLILKTKKDNNPWFCKLGLGMEVPFSSLNNTKFFRLLNGKKHLPQKGIKGNTHDF